MAGVMPGKSPAQWNSDIQWQAVEQHYVGKEPYAVVYYYAVICCRTALCGDRQYWKGKREDMEETSSEKKQQQKAYEQYVKEVTPTHNLWLQMLKAFIAGGIICCIGQGILNYAGSQGLDKQTAGSWCSLLLVLASVALTGFGIYPKIVKWGGAGALVPITGFANSVAAPAIEYKAEGQVFGIGCKIFTIAGPVILYGIFSSWVLGVVYWVGKMMGWC